MGGPIPLSKQADLLGSSSVISLGLVMEKAIPGLAWGVGKGPDLRQKPVWSLQCCVDWGASRFSSMPCISMFYLNPAAVIHFAHYHRCT